MFAGFDLDSRKGRFGVSIGLCLVLLCIASPIGWSKMAYVTNSDSDDVSPVNTALSPPVAGVRIPVGNQPVGAAVTPDGDYVLVTNRGGNADGIPDTVMFIRTSTNTVVKTLNVEDGASSVAVTPNGLYAFVTNEFSGTVSVIDVVNQTVVDVNPGTPEIDAISLGNAGAAPVDIISTLDSARVYVANNAISTITVVDVATLQVASTFAIGTNPNGIAITPDGAKLYVTNFNEENVLVLDAVTGSPLPASPINIGIVPGPPNVNERPRSIRVTPDGTRAYLSVDCKQGNRDDALRCINTITDTLIPEVDIIFGINTTPGGIAITPMGDYVYVCKTKGTTVEVISTATNTIAHSITVGASPRQVAIVGSVFLPPPEVTVVSPGGGSSSGGTPVTVTGNYFRQGATVLFGGAAASYVQVQRLTQLTCITPAGPANQPVNVTVSNLGDGSGVLANGYFYDPPPMLSSVSPNEGPESGGTSVTITGRFFESGALVTFGSVPAADVIVVNSESITCKTPTGVGTVNLSVQNPDLQVGTLTNAFNYHPAPDILSVDPDSGPEMGGTVVGISGTGFRTGIQVFFGTTQCSSVTLLSLTSLSVVTPAGYGAGTVAVWVRNTDGQEDSLASAFEYIPAPSISITAPGQGPASGGTTISILGTNFDSPGATVRIGDKNALNANVVSATEIVCLTPSGTGSAAIRVTNLDGQFDEVSDAFLYIPAPVVASVEPSSGSQLGGTDVQITGSNFHPNATVSFGPYGAASVTVQNSELILATTNPGVGVVNVRVTNPDGQFGSLPGAFTYISSVMVTQVIPGKGPTSGDTPVEILGSGFVDGATVEFGSMFASSVILSSSTRLTCLTPPHSTGVVDVRVTLPDSSMGILYEGFAYIAPPSVSQVIPSSGPASGGTSVLVLGSHFDVLLPVSVRFGANEAASLIADSSSQLSVVTPSGSGTVDVVVTNGDGQFGSLVAGYSYIPAPVVASVNPTGGSQSGGTLVTVTGSNFVSGADVFFGGALASSIVYQGTTSLQVLTPPGVGTVGVLVRNPDGQTGLLSGAFTYVAPPSISTVSPSHGPSSGGTLVTITGSNFLAPVTVLFGSIPAVGAEVTGSTIIDVVTPAGVGLVNVTVQNADSQTAVKTSAFEYDPPPVLTSLDPVQGPRTGGTLVTLRGENFNSGASVLFGTVPSTSVTFINATLMTAVAPSGIGTVLVQVLNPDAQCSNGLSYIYLSPPVVTSSDPNSGARQGGTLVTINGLRFRSGIVVMFGGFVVSPLTLSATQMTVLTPAVPVGTGTVAITVRNADGQAATSPDTFSFVESGENSPPNITPIGDRTFDLNEGDTLTFAVEATDPDDDPITITCSGEPPNAAFDEVTWRFTYKPPFNQAIQQEEFLITFVASDGIDCDTETITLTIINTNGPPEMDPIGNRQVTVHKNLNFTVTATDPDDEGQTLTYSAANLPSGAVTSAIFDGLTQVFGWSPLPGDEGIYSNIVFAVSDGLAEASQTISITVNPNRAPVLGPIGNRTYSTNTPIVIQLSATDPDGPQPDILTYSVVGAPADSNFDPATGRFEWGSGKGTSSTITFSVTDGQFVDSETVEIRIVSSTSIPSSLWESAY